MTYFSADAGLSLSATAIYSEARPESGDDAGSRAYIRINCVMEHGWLSVMVSVDDARVLAEQLPGLVMAHDAAEHQKALVKAAAEIDSARLAA
ncbi:hypothetical protein ACFVJ5_32160 [Nocardia sp. NPDC127606]|uniref:hypothetical protein n=1 Tax=Nocardia sp. NPDC127606 TaxID=3345406 RepID=UPI003643E276